MTFSKSRRLLNKRDYEFVFENAIKANNANLVILYRYNQQEKARLGLAIAKKKIAKSHDRNRLKRLIRESFRHANLPAIDIIVLAKVEANTVSNRVILDNLSATWSKLAALSEN